MAPKYDIRISEDQRIALRNALVREITACANPKTKPGYKEQCEDLHGMLVDGLQALVDEVKNIPENVLNDFTS